MCFKKKEISKRVSERWCKDSNISSYVKIFPVRFSLNVLVCEKKNIYKQYQFSELVHVFSVKKKKLHMISLDYFLNFPQMRVSEELSPILVAQVSSSMSILSQ